jgi:hypothetical protein
MPVCFVEAGGKKYSAGDTIVWIQDVWPPWSHECDFTTRCFDAGIHELAANFNSYDISKYYPDLDNFTIYVGQRREKIKYIEDYELEDHKDFQRYERQFEWEKIPEESLSIFAVKIVVKIKNKIIESKNDHLTSRNIEKDFISFIANLNCSTSIAKPGAFQLIANDGSRDRMYSANGFNALWYIVPKACEMGWPPFRSLPLHLAFEWWHNLPGVMNGLSNSDVSRGACIFSRLFRRHFAADEMQSMVWAVSGIEALLSKGERSVISDLVSKIDLIMPGTQTHSTVAKMLKKMYQARSNLVHGKKQISGQFHTQREPTSESTDEEIFATSIFIALLQTAFVRKLKCFEFDMVMR